MVKSVMKLRLLLLGRKVMTNLDSMLKGRDITLLTKVHLIKAMFFLVVIYGCEIWTLNKAERWRIDNFEIVVLEKTLEAPLDCKEIKPVHPKGIILEYSLERLILKLPPDTKNWLVRKDPDAGKDWRQEENGKTEDGMVGWHHWLNGHEFEQAPGDG